MLFAFLLFIALYLAAGVLWAFVRSYWIDGNLNGVWQFAPLAILLWWTDVLTVLVLLWMERASRPSLRDTGRRLKAAVLSGVKGQQVYVLKAPDDSE